MPILLVGLRSQLIPVFIFSASYDSYLFSGTCNAFDRFWYTTPIFSRVSELGVRFFDSIPNLIIYLISKIGIWVTVLPEVIESIEGRYFREQRDYGWVTIYDDTGILGILSLIWGLCLLAFLGIKAHISRPGIESAYSLALFDNCLESIWDFKVFLFGFLF